VREFTPSPLRFALSLPFYVAATAAAWVADALNPDPMPPVLNIVSAWRSRRVEGGDAE
jgi:hypothetical protein